MPESEYGKKIASYREMMSIAEEMLLQGVINESEYDRIDRIIAEKRGLSLSSIYCRKPLIFNGPRVNMTRTREG